MLAGMALLKSDVWEEITSWKLVLQFFYGECDFIMIHRIEICNKPGYPDVHGEEMYSDIEQLGMEAVEGVHSLRVFLVESCDMAGAT